MFESDIQLIFLTAILSDLHFSFEKEENNSIRVVNRHIDVEKVFNDTFEYIEWAEAYVNENFKNIKK
jgi:hypothetical protein